MPHSVWLCVRRCNHLVQPGTYDRSIKGSKLSNRQTGFNKIKRSDMFYPFSKLSTYIIARYETDAAAKLRIPPQRPNCLSLGCGSQIA